jgi:2-hydroxy-3-keto-5-methylthiopentenyl-1-phosphate phosphatase
VSVRLVLDWDGTVTERDTLHMVIEEFGDLEVFRAMEAEIGRRLTLNEIIGTEMATISAPMDEVVDWLLRHARVRPGFADLAAAHAPLIVSAGFHELIEPVLVREGVRAEVIANHVAAEPTGWQATFRGCGRCDVCGEACKRLDVAGAFVYVGDGVSDRCVALAAERVFARDGLAAWLAEQGAGFEPYDDLRDVLAAL